VCSYDKRARWINSEAAEMLARADPDRPVFMFLHVMDAHMPYIPDPEVFRRFDRNPDYDGPIELTPDYFIEILKRRGAVRSAADLHHLVDLYDAEIATADAAFGEFLTLLRRFDRFDDALILLVSDHGEAFREHDNMGHGHTLSREETHVPLVVRFPGGHLAGRRVAPRVSLVDVLPTVLQTVGLAPLDAYPLPGLDLGAIAAGPGLPPAPPIFAEVSMRRRNDRDLVGIIDEYGYKAVLDLSAVPGVRGPKPWAGLWDTESDVGEQTDLSSDLPVLSAHLQQQIARWLVSQTQLRERLRGDASPPAVEMTDDLRRELEALGYLY
jgi:arylsulfatase A-like enzyme